MSVQRSRQHSSALLLCLGLGAAGIAAQTATPFDSTRAYNHVRDQVAFGPRPAGSAANARTRAYIISTLAEIRLHRRRAAVRHHHARRPGEDDQHRRHAAR